MPFFHALWRRQAMVLKRTRRQRSKFTWQDDVNAAMVNAWKIPPFCNSLVAKPSCSMGQKLLQDMFDSKTRSIAERLHPRQHQSTFTDVSPSGPAAPLLFQVMAVRHCSYAWCFEQRFRIPRSAKDKDECGIACVSARRLCTERVT